MYFTKLVRPKMTKTMESEMGVTDKNLFLEETMTTLSAGLKDSAVELSLRRIFR